MRSCVSGRGGVTFCICIAIDCASAGPTQIGSNRCSLGECKITTGDPDA